MSKTLTVEEMKQIAKATSIPLDIKRTQKQLDALKKWN